MHLDAYAPRDSEFTRGRDEFRRHAIADALEIDGCGFIPDFSVLATNPP